MKSTLILISIMLIVACGGGTGDVEKSRITYKSINDIPDAAWRKLSEKRIYFGHQSVGQNIIDGIKELMSEYPAVRLNIQETTDFSAIKGGVFAHSRIEGNKPVYFKNIIEKNSDGNIDIAFFKYCFVDILNKTDIEKVFMTYRDSMRQLEKEYPEIQFIHFTVPITFHQSGMEAVIAKLKGIIKKITGDFDWNVFFDNRKRDQLNEMLRQEYEKQQNYFDIAKIQSTRSDGTRETFQSSGKNYDAMAREYTDDGGHLNAKGRKLAAEQLLLLLVNLDR